MSHTEMDIAEAVIIRTQPGDTVVFRTAKNLMITAEYRRRFQDEMAAKMPGVAVVLVTGIEEIKVFRAEKPQ